MVQRPKTRAACSGESRDLQHSIISTALIVIFICQAVVLCYFNFTQLRNHMGFDSSWNFVRSAFMWREKAPVSPNWSETSSLHLDTHNVLVSLLYGLTGDIMPAYGLANTVIVALILFVLWKILDRLNVRFNAKMVAVNLVICPWLTNGFWTYLDLGYFSMILSGASQYSLRALVALMIIDEFLIIAQKKKMGVFAWVIWLLLLLCGFSSGVYIIIVILAPCLVWAAEMFVIHNDWKQLLRKECVFFYICCVFVVAGKGLAGIAGFEALDNSRTWTSLENLWLNFGSVIRGFMLLLQVLPVSGNSDIIVSKTGFLRIGALAVFAVIILSVSSVFRRTRKNPTERDGALLLLINILVLHLLIFGLYNANYGVDVFEERYLIIAFFATVIMTALFFEKLEEKRALSLALSLLMAASVAVVDAHSDYNYLKTTNDDWRIEEIQTIAENQNAGVVYFWGSGLRVISKTMRACDLNRIYKSIDDKGGFLHDNGDYLYFDDFEEYSGPVLMICSRRNHPIPDHILAEYTLLDTLDYTLLNRPDQLNIYVCDHNPRLW